MREIKFRVFFYDGEDKSTGEYVDSELALSENYIEFYGNSLIQNDECSIIEQYTGLKDKNGKEIYEGDIVQYSNDAPQEVVFREQCFCTYMGYNNHISELRLFTCENKYLVLGNIHENPELL